MVAPTLLSELRDQGFTVRVVGDRLRVSPADSITVELAAEIAAHKSELMDSLAVERQIVVGRITHWLGRRWDTGDDSYQLDVYGVCSGGLAEWEWWLSTAPLADLQRALKLIEQEDKYLGMASPWRSV